MDEAIEDDADVLDACELDAPEAAEFGEDWAVVMAMLPAQWEAKAVELGAVRRLRGFGSIASLLRVLLIHLADGCSLRETAVRASAGGLAAVSDVALLKRLRGCGAWFEWMVREMTAEMSMPLSAQLPGRRVRLIDGSSVCEPGATGSTWRLHYALNLQTLGCDEVHVTEASVGEKLELFDIRRGDVIMADRGFARAAGLRWAVQQGADVVLRTSLSSVPLLTRRGQPLPALRLLRKLSVGQAGEWPAILRDDKHQQRLDVRVCAYKKTAAQTLAAQRAIEQEARKKGRSVKPQTLEAAGYVIVLTTLSQPSASAIMEFYRRRWQIELAFKRLKSLLQLGHLKKFDKEGARAWLQGKLLVACLVEKLILTAERFSPWGYAAAAEPGAAAPLSLA
jgi:hypothetical protein